MFNYFDEYTEVYYFNLEEAYKINFNEDLGFYNNDFSKCCLFDENSKITFDLNSNLAILNKLHNQVFNSYKKKYIIILEDNNQDLIKQSFIDWLKRYNSLINQTAPKYLKMIKLYEENESKLLSKVETITSSKSRYNDTPQSSDFEEIEGTDFASNYTKNDGVASSDVNTLMARIDEIQTHLRNLYTDWKNEFNQLFIEKENVY